MKICLLYLTNICKDKKTLEILFNNVKNSFSEITNDIFMMVDVSNKYVINNFSTIHDKIINFTWDEIVSDEYDNHILDNIHGPKNFQGQCHLPLYQLYNIYPNYDYYIYCEDDVYIKKILSNEILLDNPDIIFQNKRYIDYEWYWYVNDNNFKHRFPAWNTAYKGLMNLFIISNNALKDIMTFDLNGKYKIFHEVLFNSYFLNNQNIYNIKYLDDIYNVKTEWKMNLLTNNDIIKGDILHPIKNINQLKI